MEDKPLWSPDSEGDFHLGDLMYNIEKHKRRDEMEKMDNKYKGKVFKNDGTPVPEDEWIVFRAKDLALLPTLQAYLGECIKLECNLIHIDSIYNLIKRVHKFQKNNPDRCKNPD